MKEGAPHNIT